MMQFLDKTEKDYAGWLARLNEASERLLILDYDGTLAPFKIARDEAIPYPGVVDLLESISEMERSRIVVVSGRSVKEVNRLLSIDRPLESWGCHGWEHMERDGTITYIDPGEDARKGLAKAAVSLENRELDRRIERKHAAIALHWRGLGETAVKELKASISAAWHEIADRHGLSVKSFDGGMEIMAEGRDKGDAVRDILIGSASGSIAAYLGDDLTDEDAFKAIRPEDLGILVNERLRPTAAHIWVRPPVELIDFLNTWIETTGEIR